MFLGGILPDNDAPGLGMQSVANHGTAKILIGSPASKWLLLATSLLAVIPVWVTHYPPMSDLPQHAAQIALLKNLNDPQFQFTNMFHLNWFTPYLLGYLLIYVLAPLFGILAACKISVSLFVAGLPLSTGYLISSVGIDAFWAILCVPGAYGFAYQWGFLNFLIAAPVGICFLAFVIRRQESFSRGTAAFLGVSALILFFCHALICAFFGICAVLYIAATSKSFRVATCRLLPLTSVIPVAFLWIHRTSESPGAKRPGRGDLNWLITTDPYYRSLCYSLHFRYAFWGRMTGFPPNLLGLFPSWSHLLIAAALIMLPFCAGFRFSKRFAYRLPLLVCVSVLLWCPLTVFGTDFVYQRFSMFAIPMLLLALEPPAGLMNQAFLIKSVAFLVVVSLVTAAGVRAKAFDRETNGFKHAVALMEPGQRALSLAFDHDDGVSTAPTFLHFASWYAAEKRGVVDPSVAMMHPELVVYRTGATPKAVLWDFEWDPEEFEWNAYSGNQYRYFVVRSQEDRTDSLFSGASCVVLPRLHEDEWWLYERTNNCPNRAGGHP